MQIISKYFNNLSEEQICKFAQLEKLYKDWNSKINVISRKDIENLYSHHVLHSLAIGKYLTFKPGTKILDFGTGGGFPGIPLAILFPECNFKLIDGTQKKIMVVKEVAKSIGLTNVNAEHVRGENEMGKYDFIVSRAVMPLPSLCKIVTKNVSPNSSNALPNGIICLKGGDLQAEIKPYSQIAEITPISNWFQEEWFNTKNIIYIPC